MKKEIMFFTIVIFLMTTILSCEKNDVYGCDPIKRDLSLAGSVSFRSQGLYAEALIDEIALDDFLFYESFIHTEKVSDNEISLICNTKWNERIITFYIPSIYLTGEPENVEFNVINNNGIITENNEVFENIKINISGWIKEISFETNPQTRCSPYLPEYYYQININCNYDNKETKIKIYSLRENNAPFI